MAEVAIQKEPAKSQLGFPRTWQWEPFRNMRELLRWDPFSEMAPSLWAGETRIFAPDFDVKETKEGFVFSADLPGVQEKDLDVRLAQNRLTISGKRESEKTEKDDNFYTTERCYGSFTRSFTLPEGVDDNKVNAKLASGVLTITIGKKPEAQAKKISVSSK